MAAEDDGSGGPPEARNSVGHGKQPAATEGRDSCAGRTLMASDGTPATGRNMGVIASGGEGYKNGRGVREGLTVGFAAVNLRRAAGLPKCGLVVLHKSNQGSPFFHKEVRRIPLPPRSGAVYDTPAQAIPIPRP